MPVAVIVDWYGPYDSFNSFRASAREWAENTRILYMALGAYNKIRYVGLTEKPGSRFYNHKKLLDDGNKAFFVGEIVTQGISGRRASKRAPDLDLAEHALISYLVPELNERRTQVALSDCVSVFSRFFDPDDGETPVMPLPKFPLVIAYNSWSGVFVPTKS